MKTWHTLHRALKSRRNGGVKKSISMKYSRIYDSVAYDQAQCKKKACPTNEQNSGPHHQPQLVLKKQWLRRGEETVLCQHRRSTFH